MKKYSVEITEVLALTVEVEAESSQNAIKTVREMYLKSNIVLDSSCYVATEFSAKDEKS